MTVLRRLLCSAVVITVIVGTCSFSAIGANAAGEDDGVLSVDTKNSQKYFGTAKSDFCNEYVSANGDGSGFYRYENVDLNGDAESNITDLVALKLAVNAGDGGTDLNFDSSADAEDLEILRKTLIGITDIEF